MGRGSREEEGRGGAAGQLGGQRSLHMLPALGYLGLTVEPRRERPRGLRRPLAERAEVRIVEQHAAFLPPQLCADGSF